MDIGITHLHSFIAALYLAILFAHLGMIALKKTEWLDKNARSMRIMHAAMGATLLLSGIHLMLRSPVGFSTTLLVKYLLVVVAIACAILGSRRKSMAFMALSTVLMSYLFAVSKSDSLVLASEQNRIAAQFADGHGPDSNTDEWKSARGQYIYEQACLRCHGDDGQSQFYKSKNLATTQTDSTYMAAIIKNGKSPMPAFGYLNDAELGAVITFVQSLKAK